MIGVFASCLYPKRQPLHQALFNIGTAAMEAWIAGILIQEIDARFAGHHLLGALIAVVSSSPAFYVINTGNAATIIASCSGANVHRL